MVDATDDSIISAWALLIRMQDHNFSETEFVKTKADSYQEYSLSREHLCIIAFSKSHQMTKQIRACLFKQNGFCAEQNLRRYSVMTKLGYDAPFFKPPARKLLHRGHSHLTLF